MFSLGLRVCLAVVLGGNGPRRIWYSLVGESSSIPVAAEIAAMSHACTNSRSGGVGNLMMG